MFIDNVSAKLCVCVFFPLMSKLIIVQANSHSKCHEKSKVCNSNTFCHLTPFPAKGGFFSESAIRFLHLQISKKNIPKSYPELEIWICCLLLLVGNLNFKFRIVFLNIFFGDVEIWKTNHTFWKKATFSWVRIPTHTSL